MLAKRITGHRIALAPWTIGMPPIPAELASEVSIQDKSLDGIYWWFNEVLDHFLNNSGQLKFFGTEVPTMRLDGSLATKCLKKRFPGILFKCIG